MTRRLQESFTWDNPLAVSWSLPRTRDIYIEIDAHSFGILTSWESLCCKCSTPSRQHILDPGNWPSLKGTEIPYYSTIRRYSHLCLNNAMVLLEPKFQDKKFLCPCVNVVISGSGLLNPSMSNPSSYLSLHISKAVIVSI